MKYKDLQALAKQHGIKANQKKKALISALQAAGVQLPEPGTSWIKSLWRKVWTEIKKYLEDVKIRVFFEGEAVNIEVCYRGKCWTLLRRPIAAKDAESIIHAIRSRDVVAIKKDRNIKGKSRLLKALQNVKS